MANEDWSDEELRAAADAYREMQRLHAEGAKFNKRAAYRALAERYGRTDKAFEFRMQNISYVLQSLGKEWIPGLKPASHVGPDGIRRLTAILNEGPRNSEQSVLAPRYVAKVPAIRDWLIEHARGGHPVTYGDVMLAFQIDRNSLGKAMDMLGHGSESNDEPVITALIVRKDTGRCSTGLLAEFGIEDDESYRELLYAYWRSHDNAKVEPSQRAPLEVRAAVFASIETRPEQAAFRREVFTAFGGKCAISGCSIGRALDAAHLEGRVWREGHNRAQDGKRLAIPS